MKKTLVVSLALVAAVATGFCGTSELPVAREVSPDATPSAEVFRASHEGGWFADWSSCPTMPMCPDAIDPQSWTCTRDRFCVCVEYCGTTPEGAACKGIAAACHQQW